MTQLRATVKGDTLHVPTFACGRCHQPSTQAGSGWIRKGPLRLHVCACCKATDAHRAARVRAHLPEIA
jgi:hypothetical protein